jgi:methylamine dehydrogenase heavy chain
MRLTGPGALGALLMACAATAAVAGATPPPPLAAEHLRVESMPPWSPHWVYALDFSFNNETDERVYVYDGDHHRLLGGFEVGYYPYIAISPDHKTTAIATTYWSRGGHGTRTDVVEYEDNTTLTLRGELPLASKKSQSGAVGPYNLAYSADGKFLYVTNLTPAASVSIVDVAKNAILSEIDTDACVMAMPSVDGGRHRFSALCENGRMVTITHDDAGKEVARSASKKFFDVDRDPIFVQSAPTPTGAYHLSFLGDVYEIDTSGADPKFPEPWPTTTANERGHWRPGGQQMVAYSAAKHRLYVPMHAGGEGSHKTGGSQIWVTDTVTHKRLARWPVDEARYGGVFCVLATQDEHPLLFAATEKSSLLVFDAMTGKLLHAEEKMGQTLWSLLNP